MRQQITLAPTDFAVLSIIRFIVDGLSSVCTYEITNVPFQNNIFTSFVRGNLCFQSFQGWLKQINPLSNYTISLNILCIHLSFASKCRFRNENNVIKSIDFSSKQRQISSGKKKRDIYFHDNARCDTNSQERNKKLST